MQVVFESIEVILVPSAVKSSSAREDEDDADGSMDRNGSSESSSTQNGGDKDGSATSSGGWLGTGSWFNFQSLAIRAGLNLTFTIKNLLVKYVDPDMGTFMVALDRIHLHSIDIEDWSHLVDNPDAWLRKDCIIKGLSVSCDRATQNHTAAAADLRFGALSSVNSLPMIRIGRLRISALIPAFAYLDEEDIGEDEFKVSLDVDISPVLSMVVNDWELSWIGDLVHNAQGSHTGVDMGNQVDMQNRKSLGTRVLGGETAGADNQSSAIMNPNAHTMLDDNDTFSSPDTVGSRSRVMSTTAKHVDSASSNHLRSSSLTELTSGLDDATLHDIKKVSTMCLEFLITTEAMQLQLGVSTAFKKEEKQINVEQVGVAERRTDNEMATLVHDSECISERSIQPFVELDLKGLRAHVASINTELHHLEVGMEKVILRHNATSRHQTDAFLASTQESESHGVGTTNDEEAMDDDNDDSLMSNLNPPRWEEILSISPVNAFSGASGSSPTMRERISVARSAVEIAWKSEALAAATKLEDMTVKETDLVNGSGNRCKVHAGIVAYTDENKLVDKVYAFWDRYSSSSTKPYTVASTSTNHLEREAHDVDFDRRKSGDQCISGNHSVRTSSSNSEAGVDRHEKALLHDRDVRSVPSSLDNVREQRSTIDVSETSSDKQQEQPDVPWWYRFGGVDLDVASLKLINRCERSISPRDPSFVIHVHGMRREGIGQVESNPRSSMQASAEVASTPGDDRAVAENESDRFPEPASHTDDGDATTHLETFSSFEEVQRELEKTKASFVALQKEKDALLQELRQLKGTKTSEGSNQDHGSSTNPRSLSYEHRMQRAMEDSISNTSWSQGNDVALDRRISVISENTGDVRNGDDGESSHPNEASEGSSKREESEGTAEEDSENKKKHQRKWSWTDSLASSWIYFLQSEVQS